MTAKNSCTNQLQLSNSNKRRISIKNDKKLNLLNFNPSLKGLVDKTKDNNLAEYIDDFSFK